MTKGKRDMAAMPDGIETAAVKGHEAIAANAVEDGSRATALVSMTKSDKERLTAIARAHGLSLSAFFRLAAEEYIANHAW